MTLALTAVASLLVCWLAASVANSTERGRKWIKERLGPAYMLVPSWNFFSPIPGQHEDEYESALEAGEYERALEIHQRLLEETEDERDATSDADDRATLSYQDRELSTDLSLDEADPVGFTVLPYHGGDLDFTAFEIEERLGSESDGYEYRLIVTPPSMNDGELEATETVGADVDEPALGVEQPEMAVLAAAVAAAVIAYAATATGGTAPVEAPDVATDDGVAASVDELIEARADAAE